MLVVLGTILGASMERAGAMEVISYWFVRTLGSRRAGMALSITGAAVGIPVFCDSGFIVLSRLVPSLARQLGKSQVALSLGLAGGLYTTHTLVPPTPGPLAAAANLGVANMGIVMGIGILCSIPSVLIAHWYTRGIAVTGQPEIHRAPMQKLPSVAWAFIPLLVPLGLIALGAVASQLASGPWTTWVIFAGKPVVALAIGAVLSTVLLRLQQQSVTAEWVNDQVKEAGIILLITCAGGAFGAIIRSSNLQSFLPALLPESNGGWILLLSGYFLAAILKTAQGSTTSAMIVASSLLAPFASSVLTGPMQLTLEVMAIGAGAMTVSHANDSYFWVISRFGHLEEKLLLKYFTLQTFLQGVGVLMMTLLLFIIS